MARCNVDFSRRSPNYSAGRPKGAPNVIVIHHWGNDGQRFDNVVSWLCRANGNSSAHYVVEGGRVAELVAPNNRAWHAGSGGNPRGIGIECRPECTPADFETVAALIADLRDRYGNLPIKRHMDFMSTDCPGRWGPRLGELSARAEQLRGAPAPVAGKLSVDGIIGPLTVRRLQERFGTVIDEFISSQPYAAAKSWPALTAVQFSSYPVGSKIVVKLQEWAGCAPDGYLGPDTARAVQRKLNSLGNSLVVDGVVGERTARALQNWLNS